MAIESAADRAIFLASEDGFGAEGIYTPIGGVASAPIAGVYDGPPLSLFLNDAPVTDVRPTFMCQSADLPAEAVGGSVGDSFRVRNVTFSVADLRPDGQGMTQIVLGATLAADPQPFEFSSPIESAGDRAGFLSSDEFGDEAIYTPAEDSAVPGISGVYDGPPIDVVLHEVSTTDSQPTFLCRSADLPESARGGDCGDVLNVRGVSFAVVDLRADAQGMTLIFLGAAVESSTYGEPIGFLLLLTRAD